MALQPTVVKQSRKPRVLSKDDCVKCTEWETINGSFIMVFKGLIPTVSVTNDTEISVHTKDELFDQSLALFGFFFFSHILCRKKSWIFRF